MSYSRLDPVEWAGVCAGLFLMTVCNLLTIIGVTIINSALFVPFIVFYCIGKQVLCSSYFSYLSAGTLVILYLVISYLLSPHASLQPTVCYLTLALLVFWTMALVKQVRAGIVQVEHSNISHRIATRQPVTEQRSGVDETSL